METRTSKWSNQWADYKQKIKPRGHRNGRFFLTNIEPKYSIRPLVQDMLRIGYAYNTGNVCTIWHCTVLAAQNLAYDVCCQTEENRNITCNLRYGSITGRIPFIDTLDSEKSYVCREKHSSLWSQVSLDVPAEVQVRTGVVEAFQSRFNSLMNLFHGL